MLIRRPHQKIACFCLFLFAHAAAFSPSEPPFPPHAELTAAYEYEVMSSYFDRHDVALPGFKAFFIESAEVRPSFRLPFSPHHIQKRVLKRIS
jgi:hypothetical protein